MLTFLRYCHLVIKKNILIGVLQEFSFFQLTFSEFCGKMVRIKSSKSENKQVRVKVIKSWQIEKLFCEQLQLTNNSFSFISLSNTYLKKYLPQYVVTTTTAISHS